MHPGGHICGVRNRTMIWMMVSVLLPMALWAENPPPSWVTRFPNNPDQYIGIARVDKRHHPEDFREMAQATALAQISREISIQVNTENAATQKEDQDGWEETFGQKTTTASRNSLSGYQLAGTYETVHEFWALYTLDKEVFQKSLEEKNRSFAEGLSRESAALKSDLEGRRIQAFLERYAKISQEYLSWKSENPLLGEMSYSMVSRFADLSAWVHASVGKPMLVSIPEKWTYSLEAPKDSKAIVPPRVFLVDGETGERWKGPVAFDIVERISSRKASCHMTTKDGGELDLTEAFLNCGLEPGNWRLEWNAADLHSHCNVEGQWIPAEVSLVFQADSILASNGIVAFGKSRTRLQIELMDLQTRYFRIVPAHSGVPVFSMNLQEFSQNSFDGMFFTTIRASVLFPGHGSREEVVGKSGHSNSDRSIELAIRDFLKAIGRIPAHEFK